MANLVICLDGTWQNADSPEDQSNIALIASMIDPKPVKGGAPSQVYYDAGVGTDGSPLDRLAGGLLGVGLSRNMLEAYRFLSLNYQPGDGIFIFGFSRGAYAARSLCGFLSAAGLLRPDMCDLDNQGRAWKYYRTKPKKRFPADKEHLRRLTHADLRVRFLGVFDTVGALGIPQTWLNGIGRRNFEFHDTDVCSIVDHSCQALAIDEHRLEFEAAVWRQPSHHGYQTVEQVWFPGEHSNIGGGCADRGLSDLTLDWMTKRLRRFCPELALLPFEMKPDHRGTLYDARTWLYWRSIWKPLMRVINRCVPKNTRGMRLAAIHPHSRPIGEMLHWSALARFMETRKAGSRRRYCPPNLRAALDSVKAGTTPIVGVDGEPGSYLRAAVPAAKRPNGEMRLH
jgi:Uncharacterized alpha/beta hydrolase domain (DUF2235)